MTGSDSDVEPPWFATGGRVPDAERAFYTEEFRGDTVVVSVARPSTEEVAVVAATGALLTAGGARLVAVVGGSAAELANALGRAGKVLVGPVGHAEADWMADLWLSINDGGQVVVEVSPGRELPVAAELAAAMRARKLVVTDPDGGWGRPARSFADLATHAGAFSSQLAQRQNGAVVAAVRTALEGGAVNVNLCRALELEEELFTFDGSGTLFTSGGYLDLGPLRADDLPAVERLVAQGTADGLLRPRDRRQVARLAVTGLGARIAGRNHLAGLVSMETEAYAGTGVGELACLYTVSRFSGAGAGALLVDGLAARASAAGLRAVFAVTVSDAAAAFFARRGFTEVSHDDVPSAKWDGYDPERRAAARAFWLPTIVDDPSQPRLPL
jgi:amino-acid N-acetyltransferase